MKIIVSVMMILSFLFCFTNEGQAKKKKWKISLSLEKVMVQSDGEKNSFDASANSFSDDFIKIQWSPEPKKLNFELLNQVSSPITIMWEKSVFIDEKEKVHKIIHSKVKLKQNPKPLEPLTIPTKGKIKDMVYPRDYASLETKYEPVRNPSTGAITNYEKREWMKRDIYQKKVSLKDIKKIDKNLDIATYLENSKYKVMLVIKIEEKEYNYYFHFKSVEK